MPVRATFYKGLLGGWSCVPAPFTYFKASKAFEIARVFQNMHKGGRQNGRHFPTQVHLHQTWCVLLLKVCTLRFKTSLFQNSHHPKSPLAGKGTKASTVLSTALV